MLESSPARLAMMLPILFDKNWMYGGGKGFGIWSIGDGEAGSGEESRPKGHSNDAKLRPHSWGLLSVESGESGSRRGLDSGEEIEGDLGENITEEEEEGRGRRGR